MPKVDERTLKTNIRSLGILYMFEESDLQHLAEHFVWWMEVKKATEHYNTNRAWQEYILDNVYGGDLVGAANAEPEERRQAWLTWFSVVEKLRAGDYA
jgi:hypothetical protein